MILKTVANAMYSLMVGNAINILIVRMQNIEYEHYGSFRGTLKDMIVKDKHRMFYRGLVPQVIAFTNL